MPILIDTVIAHGETLHKPAIDMASSVLTLKEKEVLLSENQYTDWVLQTKEPEEDYKTAKIAAWNRDLDKRRFMSKEIFFSKKPWIGREQALLAAYYFSKDQDFRPYNPKELGHEYRKLPPFARVVAGLCRLSEAFKGELSDYKDTPANRLWLAKNQLLTKEMIKQLVEITKLYSEEDQREERHEIKTISVPSLSINDQIQEQHITAKKFDQNMEKIIKDIPIEGFLWKKLSERIAIFMSLVEPGHSTSEYYSVFMRWLRLLKHKSPWFQFPWDPDPIVETMLI
jgi:hypothetical protein